MERKHHAGGARAALDTKADVGAQMLFLLLRCAMEVTTIMGRMCFYMPGVPCPWPSWLSVSPKPGALSSTHPCSAVSPALCSDGVFQLL